MHNYCWCKPFSQWQHSFQTKAMLPLAKRLALELCCYSDTGASFNVMMLCYQYRDSHLLKHCDHQSTFACGNFMCRKEGILTLWVHCFKQRWAIFSCDQAVRLSVCLSVRPSVRPSVTPFWLCSHHPVIMKFSGVITSDKSDVHAKGQGQRSKVKVTEVTTQLNRFRTVTPV